MRVETRVLGESVERRPLELTVLSPAAMPARTLLLLGAVHGDEIEGVWLLEEALRTWTRDYPFRKTRVALWSRVNPDGVALGQRWNANKIDLNRNLPTQDWTPEIKNPRYPPGPSAASEPENQALVQLIDELKPAAILSAHSFSQFQVNANGPSLEWAEVVSKVCGYPVTQDIGYPTPGSLGTYAGKEKQIPTITLEIERGLARSDVLSLHLPVLRAAVEYWENKGAIS